MIRKSNYFWTSVWSEHRPEYLKSLNKASNKYIKEATKSNKDYIKKYGDFGTAHHSTTLLGDNNFLDLSRPDIFLLGKSICEGSPLTTILEFSPILVRNIFI